MCVCMYVCLCVCLSVRLSIISNCERRNQFGSYEKTQSKICLCLYVCLSVCLSVCPSVFNLLLDYWRDRNETFRSRRHQTLDGYYIIKTYCYYVNSKVICIKPVFPLILVAHIHTCTEDTLTSYLPFYLLPTSHLLLPTSLSNSYLPF